MFDQAEWLAQTVQANFGTMIAESAHRILRLCGIESSQGSLALPHSILLIVHDH